MRLLYVCDDVMSIFNMRVDFVRFPEVDGPVRLLGGWHVRAL